MGCIRLVSSRRSARNARHFAALARKKLRRIAGMYPCARALLIGAATVLAAAWLGGCASRGMAKEECVSADWQTIGYEDGLRGLPPDRIGAHRVACAKYQVSPNLVAYTEGRQLGLREYCQPKNG